MNKVERVNIIGGGLAGSEAAWQLARRGIPVTLYEMKPERFSPAHKNPNLAELVCSNSLGSVEFPSAPALLKEELKVLKSLIMEAALESRVPSGRALGVDREIFSKYVTDSLASLPEIEIRREEVAKIPLGDGLTVVAAGPLASEALSVSIKNLIGGEFLYFYDAVSPIVDGSTIDMDKTFFGSRYEKGSTDYLNIPLGRGEYLSFVDMLKDADVVAMNEADSENFFEGCLPIEEMAKRGNETLAFGPMKPVGFEGRKISDDFFAVLQLRREDRRNSMFNLVGFQTRMKFSEQKRVLASIPALAKAVFLRLGKMHRNTFINSRKLLNFDLSLIKNPNIYFCGQITGVEGYLESTASGLSASLYILSRLKGLNCPPLPKKTMIGALLEYITTKENHGGFQPMNANFGILKQHYSTAKVGKSKEKAYIFEKAMEELKDWCLKGLENA